MDHQHLPARPRARADPDRRDGEALRDERGQAVRHALQHDREASGRLERKCVGEHALGAVDVAPLHAPAAQRVDALRREADVAHHRDARIHHQPDLGADLRPALQLHRVHAALFQEATGIFERLMDIALIAHEGHVADQEREAGAALHRAAVVEHLVHGDGQRVLMPKDDHRERVADQDRVDAARFGQLGRRVVVGRDHRDGLAALFLRTERADGCGLALGRLARLRAVHSFGLRLRDHLQPPRSRPVKGPRVVAGHAECRPKEPDGTRNTRSFGHSPIRSRHVERGSRVPVSSRPALGSERRWRRTPTAAGSTRLQDFVALAAQSKGRRRPVIVPSPLGIVSRLQPASLFRPAVNGRLVAGVAL